MVKIKDIREANKFNVYRDFIIGKYNRTYFNTIDLILNVELLNGCFDYTVKDVKTGAIRHHSTTIKISEVFSIIKGR